MDARCVNIIEFPKYAVIIPAYNESRMIARTLQGIPDIVESIIVVDDASSDNTVEVVESCMGQDPRIHLLQRGSNGGVGKTLTTGYHFFQKGDADIAVVMNGDNQMDPEYLQSIVAPLISKEADYVFGSRLKRWDVVWHMPPGRLIANALLSLVASILTWRILVDVSSGYTAITRSALSALELDELYPRYGVPIDIILKLTKRGYRVKTVPVPAIYNGSDSGIRPLPYVKAIMSILKNHVRK